MHTSTKVRKDVFVDTEIFFGFRKGTYTNIYKKRLLNCSVPSIMCPLHVKETYVKNHDL